SLAQHDKPHYHTHLFDEPSDTGHPHHNPQQRIEPSFEEAHDKLSDTPQSLQNPDSAPHQPQTQPQTSNQDHPTNHPIDPIETDNPPPQTPFPKSTHYQIETDQATQAAIAQQNMNDDELVQDWEVLFMRATGLLNDAKRVNTIGEWTFLERLPSMMDLQFKAQASDYLFSLIAEANETALAKKVLHVKQPTLDYLNQTFAWEDKWLDYNEKFSDGLLNAVYPFLSTEQKSDHTPVSADNPYYKRLLAFILDSLFAFGAAYGLALLFANDGEKRTFVFFILQSLLVYFLIIIPVMEFTRLQASVGKWFVGLHVINRQGLKIGFFQSLWRGFASLFCILGFKLVVWLNLFFMYRYNLLTQDLMTRSYVTHSGRGFGAFLKRLLQKTKKP
ncbi:MAG: RDD family protein, partial [bacterium]